MANVKISNLPTASTPLSGTELVPIVQSGVTSQTTVDALALDPLATSAGASLVGYLPSGTSAVTTTVQAKLRETVSVFDFMQADQIPFIQTGNTASQDGAVVTAAIQAARDYVAANSPSVCLIFPAGTYKYSNSPNWAIKNAQIQAIGEVRFLYTGTGNAVIVDGGASTTDVYNVSFIGNFIIEASSSAQNGMFVRAAHHSTFEARIMGCGTNYAGLKTEFCVCSTFKIVVSVNEEGWFSGAIPKYGIYMDRRGSGGEYTSQCTLYDPIIEGVSGDGIVLDHVYNNVSIGGTSEGNGGRGYVMTAAASRCLWVSGDAEANTGNAYEDSGSSNTAFNMVLVGPAVISGAYNARISGGDCDGIVDNGTGTVLENLRYGVNGNTITGSPTSQSRQNLYYLTSASYIPNKANLDLFKYPFSIPHNTTTTVLTFPSTGSGMYEVVVYYGNTNDATNYRCYALIYHDGAAASIINQYNGTLMTLTLSGLNVQIKQTSGVTQSTIYAKARLI